LILSESFLFANKYLFLVSLFYSRTMLSQFGHNIIEHIKLDEKSVAAFWVIDLAVFGVIILFNERSSNESSKEKKY
jgi:hypothetical protein